MIHLHKNIQHTWPLDNAGILSPWELNSPLVTALTDTSPNTHFACCMHCILCSYKREENVRKTTGKWHWQYGISWKKPPRKWTCAAQTVLLRDRVRAKRGGTCFCKGARVRRTGPGRVGLACVCEHGHASTYRPHAKRNASVRKTRHGLNGKRFMEINCISQNWWWWRDTVAVQSF